jgi:hypothetical protein
MRTIRHGARTASLADIMDRRRAAANGAIMLPGVASTKHLEAHLSSRKAPV